MIGGVDAIANPVEARKLIGYMPESVPLYREMRVEEYLRFRARLKGVPRKQIKARVRASLELANVTDVRDRIIGQLSKGYRSRVGLADALVADPPLLILDEPTAGLDPNQIRQVRDLIRGMAGSKTVLLSTHILPEVESTCGRVVIIHRGRLVGEGEPGRAAHRRARAASCSRSRRTASAQRVESRAASGARRAQRGRSDDAASRPADCAAQARDRCRRDRGGACSRPLAAAGLDAARAAARADVARRRVHQADHARRRGRRRRAASAGAESSPQEAS